MLYSLSTQVIADTVHALVALELLSASEPTRTALSPLLVVERLESGACRFSSRKRCRGPKRLRRVGDEQGGRRAAESGGGP